MSAKGVTEAGALVVPGTTTFTATAANTDVVLNTQANNFTGALSFAGTLGNFRDISIRNTNALAALPTNLASLTNLRHLTLFFDNAAIALPALTLTNSGNLSVTAGGAITQSGMLTVPGTSTFDISSAAVASAITLTANNNFTGAISVPNANSKVNALSISSLSTALTLGNIGSISHAIAGNVLVVGVNAVINLNGSIYANAAGNSIVLAGTTFTNTAGSTALNPGSGRFLVWSANPANDNRGGLAYNFKQYNATYGATTVLGSGNGFLYTLAPTITPSLIGTVTKVYDTTTTATLAGGNYSNSGAVDGDTVTLNNPTSGTYATKNVGTNINVSVSGIALASTTNGSATVYGYTLGSTTANANIGVITAALLTITANAASKSYSTNDPAFTYQQTGLLAGDSISGVLSRTINLASESAGSYAISQGTLTAGSNYNITYTSANLTINKAPLTVNTNAASKVYGVNDSAFTYGATGFINATVDGIAISDNAGNSLTGSLSRTIATQTDENVGTHAILQGTLASSNYAISYTGANLTITQAPLSVTANAASKVYGVNDSAFTYGASGFINATVDGIAINDNAGNSLTGALNRSITTQPDENVGAHAILQGTLTSINNNYALTYQGANLTITSAPLIVTANAASKVYGVNDSAFTYGSAGFISATVDGIAINDNASNSLTGSLGRVLATSADENVGTHAILQGTLAASNYTINYTGANLTITKAPLAVTANAASKVYGVNDSAFTYSATGFINATVDGIAINDNAANSLTGSLSRTLATAVDENVGAHAILQGTLAANNYAINYTGANLTITSAPLTVTANAASKVYGTNDPNFTYNQTGLINGSVDGIAINDSLTGSLSRAVNASTNNVGTYPILQGTLSASSNYAMTYNSANLTITPATLTASLTGTVSKLYDTTTSATLSSNNYQLAGVVGSDAVTLNYASAGTYNNANVGSNKNVAVTGLTISGSAANNYLLASNDISGNVGVITPVSLTTSNVTAANKSYDGSTAALINTSGATLSGVLTADTNLVFFNGDGSGNFANPNVGNNIPVTVTSLPLGGASAGNYSVIFPTNLTANIASAVTPPPAPPTPPPITPVTAPVITQIISSSISLPQSSSISSTGYGNGNSTDLMSGNSSSSGSNNNDTGAPLKFINNANNPSQTSSSTTQQKSSGSSCTSVGDDIQICAPE